LTLYNRVRRYGALPDAGGLLDQNETTMRILDLIDETRVEAEDVKREHAEKLAERRRTMRGR